MIKYWINPRYLLETDMLVIRYLLETDMLFIRYLLETDVLFIRYLLETDMFNLSFNFYSCLRKRILWERDKLETGKIIFQEKL